MGRRKRRHGSEETVPDARPSHVTAAPVGGASSYSKLLSQLQRTAPASQASEPGQDDDDDNANGEPTAARTLGETARTPQEDENVNGESEMAPAGDEEERRDEDDDDDEEDDDRPWRSRAYEAHFGGEWPAAELDAQRATWTESRWELPGLGSAKAFVPPTTSAPPTPGRGADAVLKLHGILPSLRSSWCAAHGRGALSEAQQSLLGLLSGHMDILAADTSLRAYTELTPVLALHAAQHIIVTHKMLLRHQKKGLTPQDQGFTRPSVLVLVPFRAHALAFVRALLELLPPCYEQVENKARFVKEYSEEEGASPMPASKPEDYKVLCLSSSSPVPVLATAVNYALALSLALAPPYIRSSSTATMTTASGARYASRARRPSCTPRSMPRT